jgi:hypothetical protein
MERIAPTDTLPDVLERVVLRRQVKIEDGDVVITRERVPSLNPYATVATPWRYRVKVYPGLQGDAFNGFQNAASAAEQVATQRRVRIVYVEDDTPMIVADYRVRKEEA